MKSPVKVTQQSREKKGGCQVSRREFLLYSGGATAAAVVPITLFPGTSHALQQSARVIGYPRKFIANLSELKDNTPFDFNYPDEHRNSECMLVKMGGIPGGGGVGPDQDVVAFSYLCTHQGGPLQSSYKATG